MQSLGGLGFSGFGSGVEYVGVLGFRGFRVLGGFGVFLVLGFSEGSLGSEGGVYIKLGLVYQVYFYIQGTRYLEKPILNVRAH